MAAWGVIPKRKILFTIWMRDCVWLSPPGVPSVKARLPSAFNAIMGVSVWYGLLPGATTLGWFGSRLNNAPRFWRTTPVSGSNKPEPNEANRLWIQLTALPHWSTAVM